MTSDKGKGRVPAVPLVDTVIKALAILDCFNTRETELSLNQLCEKTGMYKSRVHRLCATLIAAGYLVRTSRTNYRVGPKLMALGKVYEKSNSLTSISGPLMRSLSQKTGESTALFVIDKMRCICMAREMGSSRLVYSINEGDNMELLPTASGRVLLAYADEQFTERVLSEVDSVRFTAATIVDKDEIRKELLRIRKRGYALNIEGREKGIAAIAAPIFDHDNRVPAALAIVGPVHRFTDGEQESMIGSLLEVTREISRLMGEV
ncbi:MAG: IclR family transcriptional regulator [Pseudomonadota bacterium]